MTTTDQPNATVRIAARELRKGDVIGMGTIKTATPVVRQDGTGYVSIRFETRIGEHGTAFPLDLHVTVFSRAVPPITLADAITGLTELAEMFERWERSALTVADSDVIGHHKAKAFGISAARSRALLARLQPATSGGFDTYCAWCQQEWATHVGGKPGVPGGPSTCPPATGGQPECGEDSPAPAWVHTCRPPTTGKYLPGEIWRCPCRSTWKLVASTVPTHDTGTSQAHWVRV